MNDPTPDIVACAVNVSKRYGETLALDTIDLDIPAGETLGLLGPNGAGKSTLVNLFTGLRRPDAGHVELFGDDPRRPKARRTIGMTPQETGLPSTLRVGEVVDFVSAHFETSADRGELLERFGLSGLERRQTGGLSGGQRRRLAVAVAFAGNPRLVFLDEPTTGLDVEARKALWEGIRAFHDDGGTVLLTSHYLEEVEALASRVVVLNDGRIIADGSVDQIRGYVGLRRVSLALATAATLPELAGVRHIEHDAARSHVLTSDADQFVRDLVASGVPFSDLEISSTSLEEAFISLVQEGTR